MPRRGTPWIAVLLSSALCCNSAARAAILEFKDRVVVDADRIVVLSDVARVVETDPVQRAQLEQLTLAPAPAAGRSTRLTYEDIRQRLLAHGVNLAHIEARGRSLVTIVGAGHPTVGTQEAGTPSDQSLVRPASNLSTEPAVSANDYRRAREILEAALQRAFQPVSESNGPLKLRCDCARRDVPKVLAAPGGQIHFEESQLSVGGPQPLSAWWMTNDGEREQLAVQVWVEAVPQCLGVKHAVPKGYVLQPGDLKWVTAVDGASGLTVLAEIVGKETTRALRAGQPLQAADLATVPLVRSGDIVTVQVRRPGMVVRRQFKATSNGALQETVTLSALDDPRIKVQAVVTGYHEATIVGSPSEPRSVIQDATGVIQFVPASQAENAP